MKRLLLVIVPLILVAACGKQQPDQKEEQQQPPSPAYILRFTASAEDVLKNEINPSTGVLFWKEGDRIGVQLDDGSFIPFDLVSGAGESTASFEGTIPEGRSPGALAVFPWFDDAYSVTGGNLQFSLPQMLPFVSDDYAPAVMTAPVGDDLSLHFTHLGGILHFTVMDIPSSAVKFTCSCAGSIYGGNSFSYTFPAGGAAKRSFCIPVSSGTLSSFTISFSDAAGHVLLSKTKDDSIEVARKEFKSFRSLQVVESDRLRLVSYNLLNGMERDYDNNMDNLVAWVNGLSPDVMVLCESKAFNKISEGEFASGIRATAARWGHSNVEIVNKDKYPVVITSSLPITLEKSLDDGSKTAHGAIYVSVGGLNLVGLHLRPDGSAAPEGTDSHAWYGALRLSEWQYIQNETIGNSVYSGRQNWIFCGDFNMYAYSERNAHSPRGGLAAYNYNDVNGVRNTAYNVYDAVAGAGLTDVLYSFNGGVFQPTMWHGRSRIDYVFTTPDIYSRVKRAEVLRGGFPGDYSSEDNNPSDHLPLLVDFSDYSFKILDGITRLEDWEEEALFDQQ